MKTFIAILINNIFVSNFHELFLIDVIKTYQEIRICALAAQTIALRPSHASSLLLASNNDNNK